MFENEEWRVIEELPHYSISNYGRVKRDGAIEARKVSVSDKGFPIVTLFGKDSKTRYLRQINKLVAEAFLQPPFYENETAVWHIDGDLSNCNSENLKWEMRSRVLEWNEMHRSRKPQFPTPRVKNNRTGRIYANAFECGMEEGMIESSVVFRVEKQARHMEDDNARYRYIFEPEGYNG